MKTISKIIFLSALLSFLLFACYDDLGNYSYKEINEVFVETPGEIGVRIPKKDSVLVEINPKITQKENGKNNTNLSYLWRKQVTDGASFKWQIIGTKPTCNIYVKSSDRQNIKLQFSVTNKDLDIVTYSETTIRLISPFSRAWFVLQNESEKPVLGCIDGENNAAVFIKDVYSEEQPEALPLSGTPIALEVNPHHSDPNSMFAMRKEVVVRMLTSTGGYVMEGHNLNIRYNYDEMLLHKKIKNEPIKPEHLSIGDQFAEFIVDDGSLWYALPDGFDIYYPVKMDDALGSTYKAEHGSMLREYVLIFDSQNKRFLRYLNNNWSLHYWTQMSIRGGNYALYNIDGKINKARLESIGESSNATNEFNPNKITRGEKLVYMGVTTSRNKPKCLALFTAGNQVYAYEFNKQGFDSPDSKRCSGFFTVTLPDNLQNASFATSVFFDRMFFYATQNRIYRVDLNRAIPKEFLIYEHPDASAKITKIKFRHQQRDIGKMQGDDNFIFDQIPSYLGAAIEYASGENGLLEMKIAKRGDIESDEKGALKLNEWKGFGRIIDMAYSFK